MRIHILIHAAFEKAGIIETWAIERGHSIVSIHTYRGDILPEIDEVNFLIVMGGPQSTNELDKYPYLRDEISFIKRVIDQHKTVLGICLGSQMISTSLSAKTLTSPCKEVGVYPIKLTADGKKDSLFKHLPDSFDAMHWHNDMPGMPENAVVLAYSEGCPRQAIKYTDHVYGLQCHMELTPELVKGMIEHCPEDLEAGKYIQTVNQLLANDMTEINNKMIFLLDHLVALT